MEHETLDGLENMSTAEILRVIVTEKLTTAAQEILAVVERTVAGYEEEALGFRQEIDRQRRQLEVLLQPEIKLETTDDQQMFPICEPVQEEASAGAGGLTEEEEKQHKYELSVEDDGSMGPLSYAEELEETSPEEQEHLAEPDYETAPRLLTPTVQSSRRSAGRSWISESQTHVDLRICILEDSHINVLSTSVFKKYPLQELRCPCGLGEADFLGLLRSTFPQLAADRPFDVFTTDRTKKLQPLNVKTLTPEEIHRTIRATGHSALYIRLKAQEEPRAADEEFHPVQREDAAGSPSTPDQTRQHTGLSVPSVQSDRRKLGRSRIRGSQSHVDLRIRILEESQTDVLSTIVFKKYPLRELRCPCGLGEADFLGLLRSTFPQLAADRPFDVFTTDRTKKLQPLNVKTLTPEEIHRTIRATGYSALYIRLKPPEKLQAREKDPPLQTRDAAAEEPPSSPDQTRLNSSVRSDRRTMGRPRVSDKQSHLDFKIRILEDSQIDVLSARVFKKYPLQELRCPRGLGEADFLGLLRSTFPQLAADRPFDVFTTDRTKKLQPLNVKTLTPEEIHRTIRSAGHSALYFRLKPPEKLQAREKDPPLQTRDAAAEEPPSSPDQTRLNSSVRSDRRTMGRPRVSDKQSHLDFKIRILEDSQIDVLSARVFKKYPLQELRCPRGLGEADFLGLLRSTFPQLAADRPFDVFTTDRTKKLQPLNVKTLTPEEIHGTIRSAGHSALYIRLKAQDEAPTSPEKPRPARKRLHTSSPAQHKRGNRVNFLSSGGSAPPRQDAEADGFHWERSESASLWSLQSLLLSESERDEEEASDGDDDDWKPRQGDENLGTNEAERATGRRRAERSGVRAKRRRIRSPPRPSPGNADSPPCCKVCGVLRGSMSMVIKHSWSHVDEPQRACGVCGDRSKSAEELRTHLQGHHRTHSCDICGKSFLSTSGLSGHVARHKEEKPHKCKICGKAFAEKSVLSNHRRVHAEDKPHKCDICQKSCVSEVRLKRHRATHAGEKPYSCGSCPKAFRSLGALSQHTLVHERRTGAREGKHACEICGRKFYTNQRLQGHLRSHASEPFTRKSNLAFRRSHWVKKHMKTHHVEENSSMDGSD